ncbi:acetyltransferase (GNAT) family protein [Brevirhabdus pacifica]|nr:GNAT family N-acetyltransferase [Brevirhabdus pacifica]PJJ82718.1 acetyltransferase (GNAT) family protein [Brevirhabdus pacifica]
MTGAADHRPAQADAPSPGTANDQAIGGQALGGDAPRFLRAMEATWPPRAVTSLGPWRLRDGAGGGKRASAATFTGDPGEVSDATIDDAVQAMRDAGGPVLFQVLPGQEALDAALATRDFALVDPVVIKAAPVAALVGNAPPSPTAQFIWPALAIMREIWEMGGIGPERLSVMERVAGPKTAIFDRVGMKPAGVGFVAMHEGIAMLHALEVQPPLRRKGAARHILGSAIQWAQELGADHLAVAVTSENTPARGLYTSLNMGIVGHYHYRAGS